jgi:cysteine-rich repeat protein
LNLKNKKLRIKIMKTGSNAFENLDYAYLAAEYCTGLTTCGNGKIDAGESCDDANLMNGDGCDPDIQCRNCEWEGFRKDLN